MDVPGWDVGGSDRVGLVFSCVYPPHPLYHPPHPTPPPSQLVDWLFWHYENQQRFSWLGVDWGARGGITARELALWTTLQVRGACCVVAGQGVRLPL